MLISSLQIQDFRNIRTIDADFAPGVNLILGPNAQGKTNLLEAIYCLVTGRSFRTNDDRELIPWEQPDYDTTIVRANVVRTNGEQNLVLAFNRKTKNIIAGGEPIKRLAQLIGRLNAVLFTPQDLDLVRGVPARRRRFMDIAISQVSPQYIHHLQQYAGALKNRNALLKSQTHGTGSPTALGVYDQLLATHGAHMILRRVEALAELSAGAGSHYHRIAGAGEAMSITYHPSISIPANPDCESVVERLLQQLVRARAEDQRRQTTNFGPHRDDFSFAINNRLTRDYGSQGQQRTCVLALKLAELDYLEVKSGETPLLMLDDLLSELDQARRHALLVSLHGRNQTFITATDDTILTADVPLARQYMMQQGVLKPVL